MINFLLWLVHLVSNPRILLVCQRFSALLLLHALIFSRTALLLKACSCLLSRRWEHVSLQSHRMKEQKLLWMVDQSHLLLQQRQLKRWYADRLRHFTCLPSQARDRGLQWNKLPWPRTLGDQCSTVTRWNDEIKLTVAGAENGVQYSDWGGSGRPRNIWTRYKVWPYPKITEGPPKKHNENIIWCVI